MSMCHESTGESGLSTLGASLNRSGEVQKALVIWMDRHSLGGWSRQEVYFWVYRFMYLLTKYILRFYYASDSVSTMDIMTKRHKIQLLWSSYKADN